MLNTYEEIDRVFRNDGYKLAGEFLKEINRESLEQLSERFESLLDELLSLFTSKIDHDGLDLACRKGCHYCCTQAVFVNPREVIRLSEFIENKMEAGEVEQIRIKAEKKNRITSRKSMKDLLSTRLPCPLLKDNLCIAYGARPAACRIYLSMDLQSCMDFYIDPLKKGVFAKLYDFPLHAGRSMNEGISSYFEEKSMQTGAMTLESGLFQVLSNPDMKEKWIRSEEVFETGEFDRKELDEFEENI